MTAALCCCGFNPAADYDIDELAKLGLCSGLQMGGLKGHEDRDKILLSLATMLETRLAKTKPVVKECFIDVFGFSRGAAQARVFCHWLNRVLDMEQMLSGVRIQFRFLGIMDTVASAGLIGSVMGNGHGTWALPDHLRILPSVLTCVHMVAMHELRKNFPLDTVKVNGTMLPNCWEFAYPGAHSDVGGGYAPAALGVSVGKDKFESDALKLSKRRRISACGSISFSMDSYMTHLRDSVCALLNRTATGATGKAFSAPTRYSRLIQRFPGSRAGLHDYGGARNSGPRLLQQGDWHTGPSSF